jgi:hypothetical protein
MRSVTSLSAMAWCAVIGAHAACSSTAHAQAGPVGESTNATESADTSTYYAITADVRRCASPMCGGWFLKSLNQPATTCHDGQSAERCYTPELDWSSAGVPDSEQSELLDAARTSTISGQVYAIVRGGFASTNTTPRPELGRFVVADAWLAEGDGAARGTFVHVQDNGVRCFVAPCPNLTERTVNTPQVTSIADVDFAQAGLSADEVAECTASMYGPDGLLVAGDRYTVQVDDRTAPGRTATQAYRRLGSDASR